MTETEQITAWRAKYGAILQDDHRELHIACQPADDAFLISGECMVMLDMMRSHMAARSSVGISANQVGGDRRVILAKMHDQVIVNMINPVIEHRSGALKVREGCLSVDNERSLWMTKRANRIVVSFHTFVQTGPNRASLQAATMQLSGLESVVVQHELDHLNGITLRERGKFVSIGNLKTA